jgi:hypothetical protein
MKKRNDFKKLVINLKNAEKQDHKIIIETLLLLRSGFKGFKIDFRIKSNNLKKNENVRY